MHQRIRVALRVKQTSTANEGEYMQQIASKINAQRLVLEVKQVRILLSIIIKIRTE